MDHFDYHNGRLMCEQCDVATLAEEFGTPLYLYSWGTFREHVERLRDAFSELHPTICFAVKCCQNIHILRRLAEIECGFDVVSGGELYRVLAAGADPAKVTFAGVGKTEAEIREALAARIGVFVVESASELELLDRLAVETGVAVTAALRVNPDVDAHTHQYTTTGTKQNKFGVSIDEAHALFRARGGTERVRLHGVHLHIGSPVNDLQAYRAGIERGLEFIDRLRSDGCNIDTIDIGGGLGAYYEGDEAPAAREYAAAVAPLIRGRGLRVILEPGRSIAANAGILVTRVVRLKDGGARRFVVVDASMNELIRPALYGAYHFVWPVIAGDRIPASRRAQQPFDDLIAGDVVGPVCESADFLAKDRLLPPLSAGDLLAVYSAGAYAMTMASQYNSRPRAAEVIVDGGSAELIRRRETYDDLIAAERIES